MVDKRPCLDVPSGTIALCNNPNKPPCESQALWTTLQWQLRSNLTTYHQDFEELVYDPTSGPLETACHNRCKPFRGTIAPARR
jgi:hypothetical protein